MNYTIKKCSKCKKEKKLTEFFSDVTRKDGYSYICKSCKSELTSKYQKQNPEKVVVYHKRYNKKNVLTNRERRKRYYKKYKDSRILDHDLKQKYGITLSEYNILLAKQNGSCAICNKKCIHRKRLSVDHDHQTNEVRGLLCDMCNNGLGRFCDDINLLESAIKYLSKGERKSTS